MFGVMQKQVERYPKGTRLKLISMEDPHGVPMGTVGEVDFIDDAGQIHMKWETEAACPDPRGGPVPTALKNYMQ